MAVAGALNAVVDVLDAQPGVHGCRMVGGGLGMSVAFLVEPAATAAVSATVECEYRERTGIEADTYVFGDPQPIRGVDRVPLGVSAGSSRSSMVSTEE